MKRYVTMLGIAAVVLVAANAPVGESATTTPPVACYSGQFTASQPRTLTLTDTIGGRVVARVDYADSVCTSVPRSSTDFLICFHVRAKSTRATTSALTVAPTLWALAVARSLPSSVCLAAGHAERGGRVPKPSTGIGPYTCYPAKLSRLIAPASNGVTIRDAFGTSGDTLVRATRICAPATKVGATPNRSTIYLACYEVSSATVGSTSTVRTEFDLMRVAPGPRDELCAEAVLKR